METTSLREPTIDQSYLTARDGEGLVGENSPTEFTHNSYGDLPGNGDLRYRPKHGGKPEEWSGIVGQSVAIGDCDADMLLTLSVVAYHLEQGKHPVTGAPVEIRRQTIGKSPTGEAILPLRRVDAWRFFTEFEPDPAQMSKTEWENRLAPYRDRIEHDRAASERMRAANAERGARAQAAISAKANPEQYLASAIASGVAQALAAMKGN